MATAPEKLSEDPSTSSWDNLAPATAIELPAAPELKADTTEEVPAGHCLACREPIIREPGTRGKLPRYHPDCRPLKTVGGRSSTGATRSANTKASREADEAVAMFKAFVVKGALMLAMIDQYDAMCVMASLPGFCENLHGVLVSHDGLRKDMLALKDGGSILGLIVSAIMCALPIAAHHGLIPSKKISALLQNMPFTLIKIQRKLAEGEAALTDMMAKQVEEMQLAREAAQQRAKATANAA